MCLIVLGGLGEYCFNVYEHNDEPILYATDKSEIGCQFFNYSLGLSPFGKHEIML